MTTYDVRAIIRTALNEHDGSAVNDVQAFSSGIEAQLAGDLDDIPGYSHDSTPLSLVRFRCMLQDTGYPMEVYMDGDIPASGSSMDVGNLKERWVGWAVEIPRESSWTKPLNSLSSLSLSTRTPHHASIQSKNPIDTQKESYLGALIKVYDDSASFRPSSTHTFVGLVSRAAMPGPMSEDDEAEDVVVPAIHVLAGPLAEGELARVADMAKAREKALAYLADALQGDELAAEYLLLALLARPSVRPTGLPPLGTLSLNLINPSSPSTLIAALRQIIPAVVDVPLTIPLLHSTPFFPSAPSSTSLDSGILQLAADTLLVIDETHLGDGGKLEEKAIKNLQAVQECLNEQKLQYAYPYMPELKMECSLRGLILSEGGRGIVRADISLPLKRGQVPERRMTEEELGRIRAYLRLAGGEAQAKKLSIPDTVGDVIQDAFVTMRAEAQKSGDKEQDAEAALKRRMRIARLLAISHESAELTEGVWQRATEMDEEAQKRLAQKKPAVVNGAANGSA